VIDFALADRVIEQWNDSIMSSKVSIDDGLGTILITGVASDTDEIFSFEAYDDVTGDPADIDSITVDSGIGSGTVRIQIGPDPNSARTDGADNVGTIDLSNADYGELVDVNINGRLGLVDGGTSGTVKVDEISGDVTVGQVPR